MFLTSQLGPVRTRLVLSPPNLENSPSEYGPLFNLFSRFIGRTVAIFIVGGLFRIGCPVVIQLHVTLRLIFVLPREEPVARIICARLPRHHFQHVRIPNMTLLPKLELSNDNNRDIVIVHV